MSHEAATGAAAYPLFVFFMFFVFFGIVAAAYQYTVPVCACPTPSAPPRPAAYMNVPDWQKPDSVYQPVAGVGGPPGGSGYQMMPGPGTCQAQRSMPERAEVYQRLMTGVTPASFFKLS